MSKNKQILIAGAGPSGLSAAIFLKATGHHSTVIDKKSAISPHSKALAINPRSLDILAPYGISQKLIKAGHQLIALNIRKSNKLIFQTSLSKLNSNYPYLLILPQKTSEEILYDHALNIKIPIHNQTELEKISRSKQQYKITTRNNSFDREPYDMIIGADGAKSNVRKEANIALSGFSYNDTWFLKDLELDIDFEPDNGHIQLFEDGAMLLIRIKDKIWRIAGSFKNLIERLPQNASVGKIIWESEFKIHHKLADKLSKDNIAIIGDAAHLHSPVGARGMNLGIEDAHILSRLINQNKMDKFSKLRLPYLKKTVSRVNRITMAVSGHSTSSIRLRKYLHLIKPFAGFITPQMRKFLSGYT